MISPDYCRRMARYNAWQNRQMGNAMAGLSPAELTRDRGAFFGSILGTANHLIWGDATWLSRFAGTPKPVGGIKESPAMFATLAEWQAERFRLDGHVQEWAESLGSLDLTGDLRWYSGAAGREVSKPLGLLVMHFFNHQTHHRGQIHAMLTAAGATPGDTDLFLMPEGGRG
ncbi:DinB family protein [Oceanicola sp. S124]|uniref:DinB family protein n=1 Tax=Oceanicola sp. S124 TaxID=1042378 RepID=UPI0002558D84|nr:DinB family protein [Oceanicola sp. S124]